MNTVTTYLNAVWKRNKQFMLQETDPVLLLFLLFMTNYRISFKIIAIIGIFICRRRFRLQKNGVFYFYLSMIGIGLVQFLFFSGDLSMAHGLVVLTGCITWLFSLLAFQQVRVSVNTHTESQLINTLKVITVLNFFVSLADLIKIMLTQHSLNPYNEISSPPYGISSGDMIGGVFGQLHLVNTVTCFLLIIFFLYKQEFRFSLMALIPFLLTGSNFGTLILFPVLLYILIVKRGIIYKYYALFSIAIIVVFYVQITPVNFRYMRQTLAKAAMQLHIIPQPVAINISKPVKKTPPVDFIKLYEKQHPAVRVDTIEQKVLMNSDENPVKRQKREDLVFYRKDSLQKAKAQMPLFNSDTLIRFDFVKQSGKITSFIQTKQFLLSGKSRLLFGAGIGSFSSRLAFITSRIVGDSKILMALPYYETPAFKKNHKAIFKYLMYMDDEEHSVTNLPFCWYNQLLGEYGLLGFISFVVLYLGFFLRRFRSYRYGLLMLGGMLLFFFFDYWFERLAVMIFFELFLLMEIRFNNVKENKEEEAV
ncbi:MAG: hypothetical protein JST26_20575 [Bacteroidetes bacterium]|nr:hypothetical protein [Bacteroidota bacterium]